MFIRQKFISNSSSTSFIAYGLPLPSEYPEKDGKVLLDEQGHEICWWDYYEKLTGKSPWSCDSIVGFDSAAHTEDSIVYIRESRQDIDYGYNTLETPIEKPEWDLILEEVCVKLGIKTWGSGTWLGWHTGMDG